MSESEALAGAIIALARAIDRHAAALEGNQPVPPPLPAQSAGPPVGVGGPAGKPERTAQEKMAAKVFAICATNKWDIADVGQRATERPMPADSRQWSQGDLATVLDKIKEWGY